MMNLMQRAVLGAVAIAAVLAAAPALAESKTVNAFAPFDGEGKVYLTGAKNGTFVGAIAGDLFVESDKGPLLAGRIVCPGMIEINLENGTEAGSGQCTITATDGAMAFAVWSCRGVHLVGCNGRLMLVGGTGRAEGISGSGPVSVRTTARGLVKLAADKDSVTSLGRGLLVLRGFKFQVPDKDAGASGGPAQ